MLVLQWSLLLDPENEQTTCWESFALIVRACDVHAMLISKVFNSSRSLAFMFFGSVLKAPRDPRRARYARMPRGCLGDKVLLFPRRARSPERLWTRCILVIWMDHNSSDKLWTEHWYSGDAKLGPYICRSIIFLGRVSCRSCLRCNFVIENSFSVNQKLQCKLRSVPCLPTRHSSSNTNTTEYSEPSTKDQTICNSVYQGMKQRQSNENWRALQLERGNDTHVLYNSDFPDPWRGKPKLIYCMLWTLPNCNGLRDQKHW